MILQFAVKKNLAIRKRLLEKAKQSQKPFLFRGTPPSNCVSLSIDLKKLKCSDYYWLFLNNNVSSAADPRK